MGVAQWSVAMLPGDKISSDNIVGDYYWLAITHFVPAAFSLLLAICWTIQQFISCKGIVRVWSDEAAGLPSTPPRHQETCWSNISWRHVIQISICVVNVLATVSIYIDTNGLLLVIIYIILMPPRSEGFIYAIGFSLESLFFWNIGNKTTNVQIIILMMITGICAMLSFFEATCETCQFSTCSHVTRLSLSMTMCLQASWLVQCGLNILFRSEIDMNHLTIMISSHVSLITLISILVSVLINNGVRKYVIKKESKLESVIGTSNLSYGSKSTKSILI